MGCTDIIYVSRLSNDTVVAYTQTGIATHCSLHLQIAGDSCVPFIELRSIRKGGTANFYCTGGKIAIDKKSWGEGILKAEFHFNFDHWEDPTRPMFWKGRIYAPIQQ